MKTSTMILGALGVVAVLALMRSPGSAPSGMASALEQRREQWVTTLMQRDGLTREAAMARWNRVASAAMAAAGSPVSGSNAQREQMITMIMRGQGVTREQAARSADMLMAPRGTSGLGNYA